MKTRPWPLVILALAHVIAPLVNIIYSARLQGVSLGVYLNSMFIQSPSWQTILVYGMMPIAGYAIYMMKKWSYPVFLSICAIMLYSNYDTWRHFPQIFDLTKLLLAYALNIGIVSYFLIPAVREVYFNPRLRWWESKPRYQIDLPSKAEGPFGEKKCTLTNLSEGGAFVKMPKPIALGDQVRLSFEILSRQYEIWGKVVHGDWSETRGYGIQFNSSKAVAAELRDLTRSLKLMGVKTRTLREPWWTDFQAWLVRLIKTGQGLLPEKEIMPASVRKPSAAPVKALAARGKKRKAHSTSLATSRATGPATGPATGRALAPVIELKSKGKARRARSAEPALAPVIPLKAKRKERRARSRKAA